MSDIQTLVVGAPVLVFGGNYSNLEATRAVLSEAKRRGIDAGSIICTGDVIGYCADPLATIEVMRRTGVRVVMGDFEEVLCRHANECGCGFEPGGACDRSGEEWFGFASRMLDNDARAWMRASARRIDLHISGCRLAVIHGGARRIDEPIFLSTPPEVKHEQIELTGCDGCIAGHSGLPFTQVIAGRLWHNAGAIGMPANDGTPRTWYSTISPVHDGLRVETHALEYDFSASARKMRQAGLSMRYALGLQNGLWPNCEALPESERAQRAIALAPTTVDWRGA